MQDSPPPKKPTSSNAAPQPVGAAVRIPKAPPPPPPGSPPVTVRLNKRMADLGLCSRREGDDWIARGWVRVNGVPAVMGQPVALDARIEVAREAEQQQRQQVTILINKPVGYVSGQAEDGHEPAVALVQPQNRWSGCNSRMRWGHEQLRGLAPAGRLDIDSIGLLVLTQDGRVARQLIGEDSDMEKEYLVRVSYGPETINVQAVFPRGQLALLRHGLNLDGEALRPAQVDWQNPEQLRFVLKQGKKRQIRRMCEQVGLFVTGLKRVRIGRVNLGHLPIGQWRYLAPHEQF
jgi:23S rRNA pseudouridine2604 synthase